MARLPDFPQARSGFPVPLDTGEREQLRLDRQLRVVFALGLAVIFAIGALCYRVSAFSQQSDYWVQHTHEVIEKLQSLHIAVETMETTARGMVIINDMSRLESFDDKALASRQLLADIRNLTRDNPTQARNAIDLERITVRKINFMTALMAVEKSDGAGAASQRIRDGQGLTLMLDFQRVLERMREEELRLLEIRTADARRRQLEARQLVVAVSATGFLLAAAAIWQFRRESLLRLRSETALRASEAKFRGLLEAAPDAMIVVNEQAEIVLLNARTELQFGYRRDELLGRPIAQILPAALSALPPEVFSSPSPASSDLDRVQPLRAVIALDALRKDGATFPVEMVLSPLAFGQGCLTIGAIRDITERRRAEALLASSNARLERSNTELRRFAYVASHDLQEPLRTVASYVELLARRYRHRLDSDADEFIQFAVDGCKRMKTLIQDLLSYSRLREDHVESAEIESQTALINAIDNLRGAIEACNASITFDPLPRIQASSTLLTQVFQNLLSNAIRYRSSRPPRVHISAQRYSLFEWRFAVSDNGVGIDPQYFEKIFVLFQRLNPVQESEGTGIGLALCKKVVESLGGRIWVESVPDRGSTFYFTLPQAQPFSKSPSSPDSMQNGLPLAGSPLPVAPVQRATIDPTPG